MTKHSSWLDFEKLLATIHQNVAPGAEVTHNSYLKGRSGRRRQVDILLSQTIGLYRARIVVECRRYKRQVTIDKVEAFVAKLGDIGAAQGVMISVAGFDAGARAVARDNRISLLTYREATDLDWTAATSPAAWVRMLASQREILSVCADTATESSKQLPMDSQVFAGVHAPVSLRELASSVVRESPLGQRPGNYRLDLEADEPLFVTIGQETCQTSAVWLTCRVRSFEYVINVRLATGHVLSDSFDGRAQYRELVSVPWDMHELLASPPARELTSETFDSIVAGATPLARIDPTKMKRYMRVRLTQGPDDVRKREAD